MVFDRIVYNNSFCNPWDWEKAQIAKNFIATDTENKYAYVVSFIGNTIGGISGLADVKVEIYLPDYKKGRLIKLWEGSGLKTTSVAEVLVGIDCVCLLEEKQTDLPPTPSQPLHYYEEGYYEENYYE